MEELRHGVFGALQQAIDSFENESSTAAAIAEARVAMIECMKILLKIGPPKRSWPAEDGAANGVESFVVKAFRAAGKAAQAEILDILKNRAYDKEF